MRDNLYGSESAGNGARESDKGRTSESPIQAVSVDHELGATVTLYQQRDSRRFAEVSVKKAGGKGSETLRKTGQVLTP